MIYLLSSITLRATPICFQATARGRNVELRSVNTDGNTGNTLTMLVCLYGYGVVGVWL